MARFHVYRLKIESLIVIDLQANTLSDLPSRMVAPLYPPGEMSWIISRLNPRFLIDGEYHVMATQRMASVPVSDIGAHVADLTSSSDIVLAATDFLFQGF